MHIIVGLGNPGPSYLLNRHNVGFILVDMLHNDYGFQNFKSKDGALVAQGNIEGHKCLLIKPQGYMNTSGVSVSKIANFYKVPLGNVIVVHDELDLPFAKIRIKVGGGAGGHNGLRSLDQHLGKDYQRIRIGIDHPGVKEKVTGHVLGNFSKSELDDLPFVLGPISDALPRLLGGKGNEFQTKVALDIQNSLNPKGK